MITRGISLIMAVVILSVFQLSRLDSSGALFSFISNNLAVNIGMIILAMLMVRLSFMKKKFARRWSYGAVIAAAVVLGIYGVADIMIPWVAYKSYDVIKPMDSLLFIEAAIVFGVCALTYEHQPLDIKMPAFALVRLNQFKKQLAAWLPKPALTAPSRPTHTHA